MIANVLPIAIVVIGIKRSKFRRVILKSGPLQTPNSPQKQIKQAKDNTLFTLRMISTRDK